MTSSANAWTLLSVLFLVSMLSQIDRFLPFILAEAIKADLGLSDTQLGLVNGLAFAVCYSLMSLPLARIADRGSPRALLIGCLLVWSAMTAFGGLATSFALLAVSRFGVALGEAGGAPAAHAIIARQVSAESRGLAIGVFAMGIPVGTMVGFAVGGAVADTLGWRTALFGAGVIGALLAALTFVAIRATPPMRVASVAAEGFFQSSFRLLNTDAFRWLFIGAVAAGFAAAPFYAFGAPFLMRTYGYSASEVGLAFGLLQGLTGIAGTMIGGRMFDRAVRSGSGRVLGPPGVLFLVASVTTAAALFAPAGWMSIALLTPGMLSFAFLLPWGFGAAHLMAGPGKEAMATSLIMIGSGLFGPALAPVLVGLISDAATAADMPNALGLGLLIGPAASVAAGCAILIANRRVAAARGPSHAAS